VSAAIPDDTYDINVGRGGWRPSRGRPPGATAKVCSIEVCALSKGGTMLALTVRAPREEFDATGM